MKKIKKVKTYVIKKKKYKRKQHFYFGPRGNCCRFYLRTSHSNIFITFTDLRKKVIICKTSGNSGIRDTKRRKRIHKQLLLF